MCECGTVDHDVCETMGAGVTVGVTVYAADFVDCVIDFLWKLPAQCDDATKSAEVYSVRTW